MTEDYTVEMDSDTDLKALFDRHPLPWSSRIPAAIAKAERLLSDDALVACEPHRGERYLGTPEVFVPRHNAEGTITATEVALAKALWEQHDNRTDGCDAEICRHEWDKVPEALIEFAQKVESL